MWLGGGGGEGEWGGEGVRSFEPPKLKERDLESACYNKMTR